MGQADAAEGIEKAEGEGGAVDLELIDAKITCTVDIFGRVINELDAELQKLKLFNKFQDVFSMN
jgi:hypothetical protein